jgi:hypothetical protein
MGEHGCKVCRVLDERGMQGYESRLVAQWKGEAGQRKGYRNLSKWLNVTILRREMDRSGMSTLGNEAESQYERLQREDTVAEEVRTNLRTAGIPIDSVEADFVSYGVVRTHLTECLGESYEHEEGDWEAESIEMTRSFAESKLSEAVRSASKKGKLEAVGDISVSVSIELECEATHVRVPIDQALRRGYVSKPQAGSEGQESPPEAGATPQASSTKHSGGDAE